MRRRRRRGGPAGPGSPTAVLRLLRGGSLPLILLIGAVACRGDSTAGPGGAPANEPPVAYQGGASGVALPVAGSAAAPQWPTAPGFHLIGHHPSHAAPHAAAWERDGGAFWFDDHKARQWVRRDAAGATRSVSWPSEVRVTTHLDVDLDGSLVVADHDARLLIRVRVDAEPTTTPFPQGFVPGPLQRGPDGKVEHWTALQTPPGEAAPPGYRGLPTRDGARLRTTVVDAGPVLLDAGPQGTMRRLILDRIARARSLTLLGEDGQGWIWTVAQDAPPAGRRPSFHLVAFDRSGQLKARAEVPDSFARTPAPPGRAVAEHAAALFDDGRVLWVTPSPEGLAFWLFRPGGDPVTLDVDVGGGG